MFFPFIFPFSLLPFSDSSTPLPQFSSAGYCISSTTVFISALSSKQSCCLRSRFTPFFCLLPFEFLSRSRGNSREALSTRETTNCVRRASVFHCSSSSEVRVLLRRRASSISEARIPREEPSHVPGTLLAFASCNYFQSRTPLRQ